MEPHEYPQMFQLEERHWWYRALRRQIVRTLRREGLLPDLDASGHGAPYHRAPDHGAPDHRAPDHRAPGHRAGRHDAAPPARPVCLDAGCGTGMNLALLRRSFDCLGLDFSADALRLARQRHSGALLQASIEQIPLPEQCCDLILSSDVLYHRGVGNDVGALIELRRCLRPGGCLLLNLPAFGWLQSTHDRAIHTARRYTRGEVIAKLERARLEPRRVHYWNWLLFPPLAALRTLRGLRQGPAPGRPAPSGAVAPTASDLAALPGPVNWTLDRLLAVEAALGSARFLPGLSIMALARRCPE